jgi:hypothetical protein
MSGQALSFGYLDQFFRSFHDPGRDRMVEERIAESREHGRRAHVRSVFASLDFLESMFGFLRDDVRRLEQRLDEAHVQIERSNVRRLADRLEYSRYKQEDAVATRDRIERYLARFGEDLERLDDDSAKQALRERTMDLRRRVGELEAPLDIAGRRLNHYVQRLAGETSGCEPRTQTGTT